MGAGWKHFKTVCRHKAVVYKECKACGIWWQGVVHDLSKFSHAEFAPAVKYYQGNRSPIEAEKEELGYSNSWLHHKAHNKHHWEYWCDYDNDTYGGEVVPYRIPKKYVIEMLCDWIGAGKVYSKEKWSQKEPLEYYYKVRPVRHFHKETEAVVVRFLELIRDDGLEQFHRIAKEWLKAGDGFYMIN